MQKVFNIMKANNFEESVRDWTTVHRLLEYGWIIKNMISYGKAGVILVLEKDDEKVTKKDLELGDTFAEVNLSARSRGINPGSDDTLRQNARELKHLYLHEDKNLYNPNRPYNE